MAKTLCLARALVIVGSSVLLSACASPTSTSIVASAIATTAVVVPTETPTSAPTQTVTPTRTATPRPTAKPTFTPTSTPAPSQVDLFLAKCPTAQEVASINADLKLSFEVDPSAGTLACTAAAGSVDLTPVKKRAYRVLQVMKQITFTKPLPWTNQQLYIWFIHAIKGIRFSSAFTNDHCCDPAQVIDVGLFKDSTIVTTDLWVGPPRYSYKLGGGLVDDLDLFVHEARHAEGKIHDCQVVENGHTIIKDRSLAYMGAYALDYYLYNWLADYSDPTFFSNPGYPAVMKFDANYIATNWICDPTK